MKEVTRQFEKEVIPVKKSRTYRAVRVNGVDWLRVAAGREGMSGWAGLDVSKDELVVVLRWEDGVFAGPWKVKNPDEVRLLVEILLRLSEGRRLVACLESTGTYGDAARQALTEARIEVRRVSGKAVRDYAEIFDGVPSQHDGKDAGMVAELAWLGKSSAWPYESASESDQERAYWVERWEAQRDLTNVWRGRLEALLARHWPEATRVLELDKVTLLKAVAHYGSPAAVAADAGAADRLLKWGGACLKREKAEGLAKSAAETAGVKAGLFEARRMQEIAERLLEGKREQRRADQALKRLVQGHAVLEKQAEAVGAGTACVLWDALGDPRDYESGESYRKAMGLNLKERSSGRWQGRLKITKRGSARVRRWLYFAALRMVQEPEIRPWYEKKKGRDGGQSGRAVTGVMRKLALALWRMGVAGTAFDAGRLFPGHPPERKRPAGAEALKEETRKEETRREEAGKEEARKEEAGREEASSDRNGRGKRAASGRGRQQTATSGRKTGRVKRCAARAEPVGASRVGRSRE